MSVILGSGSMTYEPIPNWGTLPGDWSFRECAGVAVDSKDQVFVFTGGEHPVIVFDSDGQFVNSWGEGVFTNPHGIHIGPDNSVYCVDNGDHTVRKFTPDGNLLMTIGVEGSPAPRWSGQAFNLPTHLAVSPVTGDLYISDGYGNSRVHKYTADGSHLLSWGSSGIDQGQFMVPHNVAIDMQDNVYVADRENHRVQIFDQHGTFQTMWNNIWKACGICVGNDGNVYIGELSPNRNYEDAPNVGHRVSIYSRDGILLSRLGAPLMGEQLGQFTTPHGISVDSAGDIYVAEVSWVMRGRFMDPPRELRSLQKLKKIKV